MRLLYQDGPLAAAYDQALLDLDGVVYLLSQPIPEAAATLAALPGLDCDPVFVTNNASRSPDTVAEALRGMDIPAEATQVLTSAQVVAEILRERLGAGARILVTGSDALRAAVESQGLVATNDLDAAQGIGYGMIPSLTWRDLADLTIAARNGAVWVATNLDATLPTPDGPLPGTGALAGAIATALGRGPDVVAGKPEPGIYRSALARRPGGRAIMVGDRPDSDIEGANRAGIDSLLVFTGVASPRQALALPPEQRPTYLGWSLAALTETHTAPQWIENDEVVLCGGWSASLEKGSMLLGGSGESIDAWRALCEFSWGLSDQSGSVRQFSLRAVGPAAEKLLAD